MRTLTLLLVAVALVSCAGPSQPGVPDDAIGLSKADITEIPDPDPIVPNEALPGEAGALPRAYDGSPPVIPHAVDDLLPITHDENMCVMCHAVEEQEELGPTPIPPDHYVDLRNAPGEVRSEVAGARYNCIACHAPQTGAPPLVGNEFATAG